MRLERRGGLRVHCDDCCGAIPILLSFSPAVAVLQKLMTAFSLWFLDFKDLLRNTVEYQHNSPSFQCRFLRATAQFGVQALLPEGHLQKVSVGTTNEDIGSLSVR